MSISVLKLYKKFGITSILKKIGTSAQGRRFFFFYRTGIGSCPSKASKIRFRLAGVAFR